MKSNHVKIRLWLLNTRTFVRKPFFLRVIDNQCYIYKYMMKLLFKLFEIISTSIWSRKSLRFRPLETGSTCSLGCYPTIL